MMTGVVLFTALLSPVAAQTTAEEEIARCAAHEDRDARITCLEAALEAGAPAGGEGATAVAAEPSGAGDDEAAPAPLSGKRDAVPATVPDAVGTADRQTTDAAADREPERVGLDALGLERVEEGANEGARYTATVVAFDVVGYRRLLVELENGQVWRQIDGDRRDVSRGLRGEETFEVELWQTGLGGYRMKIGPLDRTIRVDRVR